MSAQLLSCLRPITRLLPKELDPLRLLSRWSWRLREAAPGTAGEAKGMVPPRLDSQASADASPSPGAEGAVTWPAGIPRSPHTSGEQCLREGPLFSVNVAGCPPRGRTL